MSGRNQPFEVRESLFNQENEHFEEDFRIEEKLVRVVVLAQFSQHISDEQVVHAIQALHSQLLRILHQYLRDLAYLHEVALVLCAH